VTDRSARGWLLHPMLLVLWLGSFQLARLLEHAPHASLWFPPAAVTFAGILVAGRRALPAIVVACAIATYAAELAYSATVRAGVLAASSLAFAVVHVAAYGLPAAMLRMQAGTSAPAVSLRSVTEYLLVAALAAGLAAAGGVLALRATGLLEAEALLPLVAAWWIGDYAALLTLAPLVIALLVRVVGGRAAHPVTGFEPFSFGHPRIRARTLAKLALLLGTTVAILAAYLAGSDRQVLLGMLVLPVVLQLWVVHTEDRGAALAGMVAFALLTVGIAASFPTGEDALILQFAAVGLAANTYLNLAVPSLYADNARLREQVERDLLTGAMSRAWFEERAGRALRRARESGRPAALVLFDLDELKLINDTRGHAVGDAVLREVVARCGETLRADDLLGRLSGDEFVAFLPGADLVQAERAVERMRRSLSGAPPGAVGHPVTASFGIAVADGEASTLPELLRSADAAMYREKRARRGRRGTDALGGGPWRE
jgi:diguanylate cyclase (GGDEF)-like protein